MALPPGASVTVAARALVTRGSDLLLVSNDGELWYTPGGTLNPGESLTDCIRREVFEETGLQVSVGELVQVFEFWEAASSRHKVECYFSAHVVGADDLPRWTDADGPVTRRGFFEPGDLVARNVQPEFLLDDAWRRPGLGDGVYRGFAG